MDVQSSPLAALRQHHLFSGLSNSDFAALAESMCTKTLRKGQFLFHRGDVASEFFFLERGQLELAVISPNGEKKILEVVQSGQSFAEAIAFMQRAVYPVTASALSDLELVQIPIEPYVALLRSNSEASFRLLADVCRRLHSQVREIERLTVQNARGRLSSFLLDHISRQDGDEASVQLDYPRRIIASRLSVTPETFSRLLRSMMDEKLISVHENMIHIHSVAALRPYD
ncbi:MAG: Crp/Fnr family transcriptional regulator [Gammaproteobacteria bacterium]|nr:Crp/Fnr family transcriptional regulator [Gammaproteobacteria bacterium]